MTEYATPHARRATPDPPNNLELVRAVIRAHPEIDPLEGGFDRRGRITDYVAHRLRVAGDRRWGRKARAADGANLNDDGLTFLREDGRFAIVDVISGVAEPTREQYATWDWDDRWYAPGENGYWTVPVLRDDEAEPGGGDGDPGDGGSLPDEQWFEQLLEEVGNILEANVALTTIAGAIAERGPVTISTQLEGIERELVRANGYLESLVKNGIRLRLK